MAQPETPPEINYLAKDYAGFRQLLLEHLSKWSPDWNEQHPADLGQALVEVLAYAADHLSYYQDAAATEAYLGTARLRRSVKRHVRLLDYAWHEGCNSRVWVQVCVQGENVITLPKGSQLFTRLDVMGSNPVIAPNSSIYTEVLLRAPTVFETMLDCQLVEAHNHLHFFSRPDLQMGERQKWLFEGQTSVLLRDAELGPNLQIGQVLIFEELLDPKTGRKEDADPGHRHAVRLTRVHPSHQSPGWVEIEWGKEDALPFDLCLSASYNGIDIVDTSVVLGNIVLADHGRTIENEELPRIPSAGRYYPHLALPGLTFSEPFHGDNTRIWSAKEMLNQQPQAAIPCLKLYELGMVPLSEVGDALLPLVRYKGFTYPIKPWVVLPELISSSNQRDVAVEIEDDGRAYLRFGFLSSGWKPEAVGAPFLATYRIGNGAAGNIGHETLAHIVSALPDITGVRNPMRARGGTNPISTEAARQLAPQAYRSLRPCVTPSDYAEAAERHPQVVRAVARLNWTGSRRTIFIYVQRRGDQPIDDEFRYKLTNFLETFRVAGIDLEILEAHFVPPEITLEIQLLPGSQTGLVSSALRQAFSDGKDGFFYTNRWTFGQVVYQSQVIARAMAVPGVAQVTVEKFRRKGAHQDADPIPVGPLEIVRLRASSQEPSAVTINFPLR